eukprot:3894809-Rhodomonas_salina.1
MEEAEGLCDRIGIFVSGRLRCVGEPKGQTLFTSSCNPQPSPTAALHRRSVPRRRGCLTGKRSGSVGALTAGCGYTRSSRGSLRRSLHADHHQCQRPCARRRARQLLCAHCQVRSDSHAAAMMSRGLWLTVRARPPG